MRHLLQIRTCRPVQLTLPRHHALSIGVARVLPLATWPPGGTIRAQQARRLDLHPRCGYGRAWERANEAKRRKAWHRKPAKEFDSGWTRPRVRHSRHLDLGARRRFVGVRAVELIVRRLGRKPAVCGDSRHRRPRANAGRPTGRVRPVGRGWRVSRGRHFNPPACRQQRRSPARGLGGGELRRRGRRRERYPCRLSSAQRDHRDDRNERVAVRRGVRRFRRRPTHHHPPARGDRRWRELSGSETRSILLSPHCCWSPSS